MAVLMKSVQDAIYGFRSDAHSRRHLAFNWRVLGECGWIAYSGDREQSLDAMVNGARSR